MMNLISRKPLESLDIFEEIPVNSAYFMIPPLLEKVSYLAKSEKIEGYHHDQNRLALKKWLIRKQYISKPTFITMLNSWVSLNDCG